MSKVTAATSPRPAVVENKTIAQRLRIDATQSARLEVLRLARDLHGERGDTEAVLSTAAKLLAFVEQPSA